MASRKRRAKATLAKTRRGAKQFFKGKKGKQRALILAAAGVGLYFLLRKKDEEGPLSQEVELSEKLSPKAVSAGELVVATNYRLLAKRRPDMTYDQVLKGTPGSAMTFQPSVDGLFTSNLVQEGAGLWAEIKAS